MACSRRSATCLGTYFAVGYLLSTRISVCSLEFSLKYIVILQETLRRHLIGTGRRKEARTVIAALNGVPEDDGLVDELVGELDFAIQAENEGGKATWLECFSTRNYLWKRTINGMMLQFIQQLNGQNFYCTLSFLGPIIVKTHLFS